jgi:branched-chain amino acid transport system ATP-binding protein
MNDSVHRDTVTRLESRPVIRVRGLSKSFGGQKVLDDVSISLHEGEVVLLQGNNGAGKTTLLNVLTGNLEPEAGVIQVALTQARENFHFPGKLWSKLNAFSHFSPERIANEGVGRTWQDVRLFSSMDLRNNIAIATPDQVGENPLLTLLRPITSKLQTEKSWQEAATVLQRLGLQGRETSSADKISLGQCKRVAIARAVQAGAKILFLDEPLAGLDSVGMQEVLSLLKELTSTGKITLVIVEHYFNIPEILKIATTVWTMSNGKILRQSPEEVKFEGTSIPGYGLQQWMKEIADNEGDIESFEKHGARVSAIAPAATKTKGSVLEVSNLVVYRGRRLVVGREKANGESEGISLYLKRGQLVILEAPNGWGKTTLLDAMTGLVPVASGDIMFEGTAIQRSPSWLRAKRGIRLLQSRDNFFPNLTVRESLALSKVQGMPEEIRALRDKKASYLSGGELQRVVTTSALEGTECSVLLLDEPFNALDPAGVKELTQRIKRVLKHAAVLIAVPSVHF